ncbi:hypothetical protein CDD80_6542 [Ophiocordyceps camponoti-rufipedis]|uniref:WSC domain-containing protein n=1 Tax=Ophiocordyceps camponoti-rufipedis TaxID=2004952 RepID=A0A2C5ZFS4_9HYPO|nr:hypothetical protein CDD80_6542 [Ophiocordyceps camponoti-rufipedis]
MKPSLPLFLSFCTLAASTFWVDELVVKPWNCLTICTEVGGISTWTPSRLKPSDKKGWQASVITYKDEIECHCTTPVSHPVASNDREARCVDKCESKGGAWQGKDPVTNGWRIVYFMDGDLACPCYMVQPRNGIEGFWKAV